MSLKQYAGVIGDGVESILLCDLFEDDEESYRSREGGLAEEKDEFCVNCVCLRRLGLSSLGDFVGRAFSGEEDLGCCRITNDGESLSLRIEKMRSRGCVCTSIVGRSKWATSGRDAGTTRSDEDVLESSHVNPSSTNLQK